MKIGDPGSSGLEKDNGFIGGGHGGIEKERGPAPMKIDQKETGIQEDTTLRMYSIIREDLQMTPGKAMSQAGHAFKLLTKQIIETDPQLSSRYFEDGMGTNVCLSAKHIHHLNEAIQLCISKKIPYVIVEDSGHIMPPFFDGNPIVTAIGIGPCMKSDAKLITRKFNLIK